MNRQTLAAIISGISATLAILAPIAFIFGCPLLLAASITFAGLALFVVGIELT